jgi:hypothetical protein
MKGANKKIVFSVEFLPNLILHVLASAGVGYDPVYGEGYRGSLTREERKFFAGLPKGAFHPRTGDLFLPCFVFPSYFSAQTLEEARDVFSALVESYRKKTIAPLRRAFPLQTRHLRIWWDDFPEQLKGMNVRTLGILKRFYEIVLGYGDRFYEEFWRLKKKEIEKTQSGLEDFFSERAVIAEWETLTGLTFRFPYFNAVLCEANRHMDGVSLGYERDLFYFKRSRVALHDFIVHEVGTHILRGLFQDDKEVRAMTFKYPDLSYKVFESGVEFLRSRLLRKLGIKKEMNVVERLKAKKEEQEFAKFYGKTPNKGFKKVFINTVKCLLKT